jgi:hypothetical protein
VFRRNLEGAARGDNRDKRKKNRRGFSAAVERLNLKCDQETWPETSLVISNIETDFFPPNTGFSLSSALIWVLTFLSWRPFFLM